tara:strand:+ start:1168 stop:1563 length:396 start_codon:yes stop_codon:yes gene_type:complete
MAFNVNSFVKSATKSVEDKLFDRVISAATSKLPMGLLSSASSTAQSLFNAGASFESISAFATQKTDSIVNQSAEMYFALAGKDPARVAGADLKLLRTSSTENLAIHLQEINPSTKIASKKKNVSVILDAIL